MNEPLTQHRPNGFFSKLPGLMLFVLLLGIGLVGLVLPIIPGLLFLLLAVYVLTRVSRRFAFLAQRNSWLRKSMRRIRHAHSLPAADLVRLSFWVIARGMVNGAAAITAKCRAIFS